MTQHLSPVGDDVQQKRKLRIRPEGHSDEYLKLRDFLANRVAEAVQQAVGELIPEIAAMAERLEAQESLIRQLQSALLSSEIQQLLISVDRNTLLPIPPARWLVDPASGPQYGQGTADVNTWYSSLVDFGNKVKSALADYDYRIESIGTPRTVSSTFTAGDYPGSSFQSLIDDALASDDDINRLINDLSRDTDGDFRT